jgi:hypothetical protein
MELGRAEASLDVGSTGAQAISMRMPATILEMWTATKSKWHGLGAQKVLLVFMQ